MDYLYPQVIRYTVTRDEDGNIKREHTMLRDHEKHLGKFRGMLLRSKDPKEQADLRECIAWTETQIAVYQHNLAIDMEEKGRPRYSWEQWMRAGEPSLPGF